MADVDAMTSVEARLMAAALADLRSDMSEMRQSLNGVQKALEALVRMDEQQINQRASLARAFDEIRLERERREGEFRDERLHRETLQTRLHLLEVDAPSYKELRHWVIGGVLTGIFALLGALGTIVFKVVIADPVETHFRAPTKASVMEKQ